MLFFYGPLLLIMVTTLVVYGRTHASITLVGLVAGCAGWGYEGHGSGATRSCPGWIRRREAEDATSTLASAGLTPFKD